MRKQLFAIAALAIATIGPPAAIAATGAEVKTAYERAAPSLLVDLVPQHAAQPIGVHVADGGKLDAISPAIPAAAPPSSPPLAVAAAGVARDRDPVAYHLRL